MEAVLAFKVDVIHYLINKGADLNKKDNNGCTCLMRASYGGYTDLVIFLLNKGADKDVVDNEGNKAIHYVRTECFDELKGYLK